MPRFCRQLHYSRDFFTRPRVDQDFYFKTKSTTETSEIFQDQVFFGQDQDQDLAPQDQDLHTVSDNLAKDSYKPYTWLNKIM